MPVNPDPAPTPTPEQYFTFDAQTQTITDYDVAGGTDVVIPATIGGGELVIKVDAADQGAGIKKMTVGSVSETYAPGGGRGLLSQEAKELLRPWLLGSVNII